MENIIITQKTIDMKKLLTIVAVALMISPILSGCQKTEVVASPYGEAAVKMEFAGDAGSSGFSVLFTPSENTSYFEYAVGYPEDYVRFANGEMEKVSVEGNEPVEVAFDELNPLEEYSVFAQAYDSDGKAGSVSVLGVSTQDDKLNIQPEYITDHTAGICVNFSDATYELEYYFGTPEDKDAFLSGETENKTLTDVIANNYGYAVVANRYDLEADTEYAFFLKAYDRIGKEVYKEYYFRTAKEGQCPKVSMKIESIDAYKGKYTFEANDMCSKMAVLMCPKGKHDAMLYTDGMGQVMKTVDVWGSIGFEAKVSMDESFTYEYITTAIKCGVDLEAYVVTYDSEYVPRGLQHFDMRIPDIDANAPDCTVDIQISDITENGATYTYTPDENVLAFFYETVDADWYDNFRNTGEWYELYLHEYLVDGGYFAYCGDNDKPVQFIENTGVSNYRYYAAACPLNANGIGEGWQSEVLVEYRTK